MDDMGIYGSHIWLLYKDICGQNLVQLLGLLRAYQLGFVSRKAITGAIESCREPLAPPHDLDVANLLAKVQERLPRFAREGGNPA